MSEVNCLSLSSYTRVSSSALTICPLIHRAEVVKNLKFRPCGVFGLVTDSGTVVSAFGAGQLKICTSPQRFCYSFRYPTFITILFTTKRDEFQGPLQIPFPTPNGKPILL
ncbi:hypothetical protein LB506_005567 [Fusarium annulatum]|nr:hypothetical protein LB506_005567 [Fusarium annulatum]